MKTLKFILVAFVFIICVSCDSGDETCDIVSTGVLTGKYTKEESFVYSDPDGSGMSAWTHKYAILNEVDTLRYDTEYPKKTILLHQDSHRADVKIGDTVCVFRCGGRECLAKKSDMDLALDDCRRENAFRWPEFLSRFLILVIPFLFLALYGLVLYLFDWESSTACSIFLLIAGCVLGALLTRDISILY